MPNPFEEPFAKPKQRKPGIAPLVGDMFGPGAQEALEKVTGGKKEKPTAPVPQEDWGGGNIQMSAAEREKIQIEKEHVRLHSIPTFTELPDKDSMKKDFNINWILEWEHRSGHPPNDFVLTDADLMDFGLDERTRARIMEAMSTPRESLPLAKVFDIADIIRQKQQADPKHQSYLTTKEVFEAIDAAGYRPSTLQELLAYGRDHWKPEVDSDSLPDEEEKRLQFADVHCIYAFGSLFSDADGILCVPCLNWEESERRMCQGDFDSDWNADDRFLVVRR